MSRILAICLLIAGCAAAASAHTSAVVAKTCPLCGTKFKTREDMSGTSFGMRLDLKPLGPIPAPWSVAVCPNCKFVLYNDDIPEEELAKCRKIVESDQYKKQRDRASYFLLGLLYEGLNRDDLDTAHIFLKASWQEEGNEEHLREVLELSLKHFDAYLKNRSPAKGSKDEGTDEDESSAYDTARLLKAEILRRVGRFDQATKHLQTLQKAKEFQDNFLGDIVRYEIKLCNRRDAKPHEVSEVERAATAKQPAAEVESEGTPSD